MLVKNATIKQVWNPCDLVDYLDTWLIWDLAAGAAHFHGLTISSVPLSCTCLTPLPVLLHLQFVWGHQWHQLPFHQIMWAIWTTPFTPWLVYPENQESTFSLRFCYKIYEKESQLSDQILRLCSFPCPRARVGDFDVVFLLLRWYMQACPCTHRAIKNIVCCKM